MLCLCSGNIFVYMPVLLGLDLCGWKETLGKVRGDNGGRADSGGSVILSHFLLGEKA